MHWAASRLTSRFRCGRWGLKARVPPGRLIRRQTRDGGWAIKCGCISLPGLPVRQRAVRSRAAARSAKMDLAVKSWAKGAVWVPAAGTRRPR